MLARDTPRMFPATDNGGYLIQLTVYDYVMGGWGRGSNGGWQ